MTPRHSRNNETSMVRSSAAEYLTFVAASGKGGIEAVYADENVWLTQKMMRLLYDVETHTINYHLKKVFSDSELEEDSVIRNFRITATDGKSYSTKHYNLAAIISKPDFVKCVASDTTINVPMMFNDMGIMWVYNSLAEPLRVVEGI